MQIVIPMAGASTRFFAAGYTCPKPLVKINGKTMIQRVIDLYSSEDTFVFVCDAAHLNKTEWGLERHLKDITGGKGRVVGVEGHNKGPVISVLEAREHLDIESSCLVTYCDFGMKWNRLQFDKVCVEPDTSGVIIGYRGFHPHNLRSPNHGHFLEKDGTVLDVKEKGSFLPGTESEMASAGVYFFRSTADMIRAFKLQVRNKLETEGEYYVSMAYTYYPSNTTSQKLKAFVIDKFLSWGTPEDVQDYQYYECLFQEEKTRVSRSQQFIPNLSTIVLGAGSGTRFSPTGAKTNKAEIEIQGVPMILRATEALPPGEHLRLLLRSDFDSTRELARKISQSLPQAEIVQVDHLTKGQAVSAISAAHATGPGLAPLTQNILMMPCDVSFTLNHDDLQALMQEHKPTLGVFVAQNYPPSVINPDAYSWVSVLGEGKAPLVSVKGRPPNPSLDLLMTGAFYFSTIDLLDQLVSQISSSEILDSDEIHIDYVVRKAGDLGINLVLLRTTNFVSWGTPNELKVYDYWAEYFASEI